MLRSLARMQSTEDLVDILRCRYEETNLSMLGAAFFERGWLAPSVCNFNPINTVGLGDIGYMNEAGNFVAVDNVHRFMQAENEPLSWNSNECLQFSSGDLILEHTTSEYIESKAGKAYQRRR